MVYFLPPIHILLKKKSGRTFFNPRKKTVLKCDFTLNFNVKNNFVIIKCESFLLPLVSKQFEK
jgi:hypothetical protein